MHAPFYPGSIDERRRVMTGDDSAIVVLPRMSAVFQLRVVQAR